MSVKWCITEDWKTPAKGEEWHEAKDRNEAWRAMDERIMAMFNNKFRPGCRWCHMNEVGTVVDFGSHTLFGLIGKEKA